MLLLNKQIVAEDLPKIQGAEEQVFALAETLKSISETVHEHPAIAPMLSFIQGELDSVKETLSINYPNSGQWEWDTVESTMVVQTLMPAVIQLLDLNGHHKGAQTLQDAFDTLQQKMGKETASYLTEGTPGTTLQPSTAQSSQRQPVQKNPPPDELPNF